MKPFLMLGVRPEDVAADGEYDAILRCTGLDEGQLQRVRTEQTELGTVDLDQWSGIILGGGPYQASDPEDVKSATQRRVEAELNALLDEVVERDFPFLGACYGIGTLGRHQGAVVDRTYAEPIGGIRVKVTRGDQQAAGTCTDARLLGELPGAGLSHWPTGLRDPVPPGA